MSINLKSIVGLIVFTLSFFISVAANAQTQTTQNEDRAYIKIEIKGLACPYCAYGMEKELKKVAGVNKVEIELKTGMAYISTPIAQKPTKENLTKIVTDAGFTAGEIEIKDVPFNYLNPSTLYPLSHVQSPVKQIK